MLDKSYDPASFEGRIYAQWEAAGAFSARPESPAKPFTIVIPPPNVTGSLHIGHALNNTLQDILIRWRRMQGRDALWMPGTDHAGIATQMVVERMLAQAGNQDRRAMGREAFVAKVWEWKAQSGGTITRQLRRLGASLDWPRERFTMDEGLSEAVVEVFVRLHRDGLIYRDRRLVNWDPVFQTAISDLEVESREVKGSLWHLRYPVEGEPGRFLVVATTRPETLLGDTAVAVHPEDERFRDLVGKLVILPLVGRRIPVVADEYSDPEKGSGAVKITPAHDFNDFEVGRRHALAMPSVLDADARVTLAELHLEAVEGVADPAFTRGLDGLDRFEARKRIVAELERLDLVEKIEPHTHMVPHGDRSGVPIEPRLTMQWYVDAKTLAAPAIRAVETGQTVFVPRQFENTYFAWMRDIQPWCVSRQLWWGHQIPAWYAPDGEVFVARTEAEAREQARAKFGRDVPLERDPDVLDTWFSSALWPFSTLGWPRETPELKKYYPGDVLVTGFDIIFFWVARMMMMGIYCMGEVPFRNVCIHGLVRDEKGQKMSKSKGNVMDPLELIDAYGADALRFTIAALNGPGRDIKLGRQRVEGYRSFCTKIWNAARFVQMNAAERNAGWRPSSAATVLSRWLAAKLNSTLCEANHALNAFRFDEYARSLYQFTWNTYCDWFIELAKPALTNEDAALRQDVSQAAHFALEQILRALHPVMPFITSEVFERMGYGNALDLPRIAYPTGTETSLFEQDMSVLEVDDAIQLISAVRSARQALNVPLSATPVLRVEAQTSAAHLTVLFGEAIRRLARVERFEVVIEPSVGAGPGASLALGGAKMFIPLGSIIDVDVERRRLHKELEKVKAEGERLAAKLANPSFRAKADEVIIYETEGRFGQVQDELKRLTEALGGLG